MHTVGTKGQRTGRRSGSRVVWMGLLAWTLLATGTAWADSAPVPKGYEVKQIGPDVRVRVSTCDGCFPEDLELRRTGEDTVDLGMIGLQNGEIVDSWEEEIWFDWAEVEVIDECVPTGLGGTSYTYDFVHRFPWDSERVYGSAELEVSYSDICQNPGCGATHVVAQPGPALPMTFGLALVLLGAVTLWKSRRDI
jgi:hypothetical protein